MSESVNVTFHRHEIALIQSAMEWFDRMWPFDPRDSAREESPFWVGMQGELLPPKELAIHHFDGYRIGFLRVTEDGQTVFVRDYEEDPR